MKYLVYILVTILLATIRLYSSDKNIYSINIHVNRHLYYGTFKNLGGIPDCCPDNRTGNGMSPSLNFSKPISLYSILFDFSLGINLFDGNMSYNEQTPVLVNNQAEMGIFTHDLEFDLYYFDVSVSKSYKIEDLIFSLGFGNHFLLKSNYSQLEKLTTPDNYGVFSDTHTRVRNKSEGSIPNISNFVPFLIFDFSYQFIRPIENQFLSFHPYLHFEMPLLSILQDQSWRYFSIGLGLKFTINP